MPYGYEVHCTMYMYKPCSHRQGGAHGNQDTGGSSKDFSLFICIHNSQEQLTVRTIAAAEQTTSAESLSLIGWYVEGCMLSPGVYYVTLQLHGSLTPRSGTQNIYIYIKTSFMEYHLTRENYFVSLISIFQIQNGLRN